MNWNVNSQVLGGLAVIFLMYTGGLAIASTGEEPVAFNKAAEESTIEAYKEFRMKYQEGIYANQAQTGIETIRYCQAKLKDTEELYRKFLDDFPDSRFFSEIRSKIIKYEVWEVVLHKGIIAGIKKGKEDVEKEGTFRIVNRSEVNVEVYGVEVNPFDFLLGPGEQRDYRLKGYVTMVFKSSNMAFESEALVAYADGRDHLVELSYDKKRMYSGKLKVVENTRGKDNQIIIFDTTQ